MKSIPLEITRLGKFCFTTQRDITAIIIPNSVTSIGNYCFSFSTNLTKIVLSSNLKNIGDGCFSFNNSLKEIIIPDSVIRIKGNICYECPLLTSMTVPTHWQLHVNRFFNNTEKNIFIRLDNECCTIEWEIITTTSTEKVPDSNLCFLHCKINQFKMCISLE